MGKEKKPLAWLKAHTQSVKHSIIPMCINPSSTTITGDNLLFLHTAVKTATPNTYQYYTEDNTVGTQTHLTYQRWKEDNAKFFAKIHKDGEEKLKPIESVENDNPAFCLFREKYLASRNEKSGEAKHKLTRMLERDKKKVLDTHPEWKDTVEEHLIKSALTCASFYITDKPEDRSTITFIWYAFPFSETMYHAIQFARENAEKYGWFFKKVEQYIFNLREFQVLPDPADCLLTQDLPSRSHSHSPTMKAVFSETQLPLLAEIPLPVLKGTLLPASPPESEETFSPSVQAVFTDALLQVRQREGDKAMVNLMFILDDEVKKRRPRARGSRQEELSSDSSPEKLNSDSSSEDMSLPKGSKRTSHPEESKDPSTRKETVRVLNPEEPPHASRERERQRQVAYPSQSNVTDLRANSLHRTRSYSLEAGPRQLVSEKEKRSTTWPVGHSAVSVSNSPRK